VIECDSLRCCLPRLGNSWDAAVSETIVFFDPTIFFEFH